MMMMDLGGYAGVAIFAFAYVWLSSLSGCPLSLSVLSVCLSSLSVCFLIFPPHC
jgi:hypothetical protein